MLSLLETGDIVITMPETYKIVRHYFKGRKVTLQSGMTLQEAQEHCNDPDTSSRTCTDAAGLKRTRDEGPWFDGYYREE
jgi:hypothetical protein